MEIRESLEGRARLLENALADVDAAKKGAILAALVDLLADLSGEVSGSPESVFSERRPNARKARRELELQWIVNRLRPK